MKVTINEEQVQIFVKRMKFCNTLSGVFSRLYFKIGGRELVYLLRGGTGVYRIKLDIDCDEAPRYFAVDYNKWQMALIKFDWASELIFDVKENSLSIMSNKGRAGGVISLGISNFNSTSSEALVVEKFLETKKNELSNGKTVDFTEEIVSDLAFADNFFAIQASKVNSVGLGKNCVLYSDRATVLKLHLSEDLPDEIFEGLGEDYIYIHSFIIKLLKSLTTTNSTVLFNRDFGSLYWEDDSSALFIVSDEREVAFPTEEQWEMIKPSKDCGVVIGTELLKKGLEFFTGFYEGSMWKPISFSLGTQESFLTYKHPTSEVVRPLEDVTGNVDGSFNVDSETLRKIVSKIDDSHIKELNLYYDDEAPGIYIEAGDMEAVMSKLENY